MNICVATTEIEPIAAEDFRDILDELQENLLEFEMKPSDLFQFACLLN